VLQHDIFLAIFQVLCAETFDVTFMKTFWFVQETVCHSIIMCTLMFFRHLRKYLNEDIVKDLVGDARAIAELEKEWEQLSEDRLALRQIFPSGESKVSIIMLEFLIHFYSLQVYNCWLLNSSKSFEYIYMEVYLA